MGLYLHAQTSQCYVILVSVSASVSYVNPHAMCLHRISVLDFLPSAFKKKKVKVVHVLHNICILLWLLYGVEFLFAWYMALT